MSAIDTNENQYEFLTDELTTEAINTEFDFVILPMANIFNSKFRHYLESSVFDKIKIPVYVIACGVQADNYESLDLLIDDIGDLSKRFISAIYNTGGEFALRGYFTKEFFERLGFPSAVVTGCPSMFQMGSNFVVNGSIQNYKPQKPVFNGNVSILKKLMEQYQDSIYIDQDAFWQELYAIRQEKPVFRKELAFYCNSDPYYAKLLGEDRIRLVPDMYNWSKFLQKSGFDYSFGSRIHGTIMAILSGIPATIVAIDSRTQEMAEYFDIPLVKCKPGHVYTQEEMYAFYEQADYSRFNKTYHQKYQVYENFLIQHGIVSHVNQSNTFFDSSREYIAPPQAFNVQYYREMSRRIKRDSVLLAGGKLAVTLKNKLSR